MSYIATAVSVGMLPWLRIGTFEMWESEINPDDLKNPIKRKVERHNKRDTVPRFEEVLASYPRQYLFVFVFIVVVVIVVCLFVCRWISVGLFLLSF